MFVSKPLVYLQLQRTGSEHIVELLLKLIPGQRGGHHTRVPEGLSLGQRVVAGSVRNPWDWYVSMWAYCCSGRGLVHFMTATRPSVNRPYHWKLLTRGQDDAGAMPLRAIRSLFRNVFKPVERWRSTCRDPDSASQFRRGLKMVFDRRRRFDVGRGFGCGRISKFAGLMTYSYLRLYSRDVRPLFFGTSLNSVKDLHEYDGENNILDQVIRTESLEDDLLRTLRKAGVELTEDQVALIKEARQEKVNRSNHQSTAHYYDR